MSEANCEKLLLPKGEELVLSSSPHIHAREDVRGIMLKVCVCLLPATVMGIYFFGWAALQVIVLTVLFSVGAEMLWCRLAGKPVLGTVKDCSAALTGLLLALNLSAGVPWWICLIGAFLAIWLGKQVFGGLGHNPFNPALVARVALLIALPAYMTLWIPARDMGPENAEYAQKFYTAGDWQALEQGTAGIDQLTCATPLGGITAPGANENAFADYIDGGSYWNYFIGNVGGCLGETSALALLIGGVALMLMRLSKWQIPVFYIATVAVVSGVVNACCPTATPPALFHLLTGGLMLGAFFMATDMVTSPITGWGCVIFGVGCGIITCVIRLWGSYPEGVSFSILLMNALVPLIDRCCQLRPFGYVRRKAAKKEVAA